MSSINWKINHLKEELQKLTNLSEDRKFTCSNCGQVFEKRVSVDGKPETLCYDCECFIGKRYEQQKAEEALIGAQVVAVEIKDSDSSELSFLIVEKNTKKFELKVGGWDEYYVEVNEV